MPTPRRSTEELVEEREALEELLKTKGWAIFEKGCAEEWSGSGYFARMGAALQKTDPLAPKVVHEVSLEIQRLFTKVRQRVLELKGVVE